MFELLKTYSTVEVWTLIVAIATFVVTCLSYRYSRKSSKKNLRNLIARKQAQLKAMEESMRWGVEVSAAAHLRVEIAALRAEIEELKTQL
jgi:hypothetical protein